MPRYHFHVKDGLTLKDHRGMEMPADQDARAYAEKMAETVSRSGWQSGTRRSIVVADDDGNELFSVRVPHHDEPPK